MKNHHVYSEDTLTHARRESVYAEGELAFKEGQRRACNPYAAGSPTLEQVWWNGWDHGRRVKQREGLLSPGDERKWQLVQALSVLPLPPEPQKAG